MNEVKVINTDFAMKQAAASSSTKQSVDGGQVAAQLPTAAKDTKDSNVEVVRTPEALVEAVASLNEYIQTVQRDLMFRLDDASGRTVITVVDSHTDSVVRQMPNEVALRLAQELQQDAPISLFNARV